MTTHTRPLEPSDRDAWEPLWQGYLDFYRVALPDDVTDTTWRRLLDPAIDLHGRVAVNGIGSDLLGIVHFLFHPVTWSTEARCYLEDLYVAPSSRGTGAGRRLIEAVYDAADARGADQVYWLTEDDNHTAQHLYDRIGRRTRFIKYQR